MTFLNNETERSALHKVLYICKLLWFVSNFERKFSTQHAFSREKIVEMSPTLYKGSVAHVSVNRRKSDYHNVNSAAKNERTAVFWDTSRESHDVRLHEDTSESLAGYTGRSSA